LNRQARQDRQEKQYSETNRRQDATRLDQWDFADYWKHSVTMSVLRDLLVPGLAVVFCGTAAGAASARRRAYYAGPGNAFWPTLFRVGLTPRRVEPEEYECITEYGLGLTDLAKFVAGSDNILAPEHFDADALHAKIRRYRPQVLAFTSKRAAEEFLGRSVGYGVLAEKIDDTALFVLPSPSGAARRYWSEEPWHALACLRGAAAGS
jgi:double-stranded uracil-DNA glycosylase